MRYDRPMINNIDDALKYICEFGKKKFVIHLSHINSIALHGGSLSHPITISLIDSASHGKWFGKYYNHINYRLVIKDGKYRTKYELKDRLEFDEILNKIKATALELKLKIIIHNESFTDEHCYKMISIYGLNNFTSSNKKIQHNKPE